MRACRARSTASEVGAPTATTVPKPAAHAFWMISNPARPETNRPRLAGRKAVVEVEPPDDLVDRVVAADVLAHDGRLTVGGEGRRRVHAPGEVEQLLAGADPVGDRQQHPGVEGRPRVERAQPGDEGLDVGRPADPARRRRRGQPGRGRRRLPAGGQVDDVERGPLVEAQPARPHPVEADAVEQPLGVGEADGQLVVVTRRAHGRGDRVAVEADLQRLLDRHLVGHPVGRAVVDAAHQDPAGAGVGHRPSRYRVPRR